MKTLTAYGIYKNDELKTVEYIETENLEESINAMSDLKVKYPTEKGYVVRYLSDKAL